MIVISGSTGFIGRNLVDAISGSTGLSLRDEHWRKEIRLATCIINLVGKAHDHKGSATEGDYFHANVNLTKEVFYEFLNSSADLMIHVSSIAALEELESINPLTELDKCRPKSWYGKSKRSAEEWLLSQDLPHCKKLIILRPPMIFGPGDKGNLGLLYSLITKRIPYPLASFTNSRSFLSIYNFVYFIEQIIKNKGKLESGIYHIADNESISTNDIIKIIKETTGKKSFNIALPKWLVKGIAKIGDVIPIPLNSIKLKKMTANLLVSNDKIKNHIGSVQLPLTTKEGMVKTFQNFTIK